MNGNLPRQRSLDRNTRPILDYLIILMKKKSKVVNEHFLFRHPVAANKRQRSWFMDESLTVCYGTGQFQVKISVRYNIKPVEGHAISSRPAKLLALTIVPCTKAGIKVVLVWGKK